jgi:hypothetical protein
VCEASQIPVVEAGVAADAGALMSDASDGDTAADAASPLTSDVVSDAASPVDTGETSEAPLRDAAGGSSGGDAVDGGDAGALPVVVVTRPATKVVGGACTAAPSAHARSSWFGLGAILGLVGLRRSCRRGRRLAR